MNSHSAAEPSAPSGGICFFEKWLSVWVALSIAAGIGLGSVVLKIRINLFNGGNAGSTNQVGRFSPVVSLGSFFYLQSFQHPTASNLAKYTSPVSRYCSNRMVQCRQELCRCL